MRSSSTLTRSPIPKVRIVGRDQHPARTIVDPDADDATSVPSDKRIPHIALVISGFEQVPACAPVCTKGAANLA